MPLDIEGIRGNQLIGYGWAKATDRCLRFWLFRATGAAADLRAGRCADTSARSALLARQPCASASSWPLGWSGVRRHPGCPALAVTTADAPLRPAGRGEC
ncbi:hypothetical protein CXK95_08180 [Stutzerimonas degradans]|uniref:Uncharacterized protein n=1 Tax=Stutzerimonas degradans TaxID=2968968 RepID=A0A8E2U4J3_9GAMM|nr:hypothetical protein CXK95_08180 [Stutzerimonas degradans]